MPLDNLACLSGIVHACGMLTNSLLRFGTNSSERASYTVFLLRFRAVHSLAMDSLTATEKSETRREN